MQFGNYKLEIKATPNLKEDSLLILIYKYIITMLAASCQKYMELVQSDEVFFHTVDQNYKSTIDQNNYKAKKSYIKSQPIYIMHMKAFREFLPTQISYYSQDLYEYICLLISGSHKVSQSRRSQNKGKPSLKMSNKELESWLTKNLCIEKINQGYEQYMEELEKSFSKATFLPSGTFAYGSGFGSSTEASYILASHIFSIDDFLGESGEEGEGKIVENGDTIVGSSLDIGNKLQKAKSFLQKTVPELAQTVDQQTQENPWFIVMGIITLLFVGFMFVFLLYFTLRM